jgi:hypothetical protein
MCFGEWTRISSFTLIKPFSTRSLIHGIYFSKGLEKNGA